jgi:hypothetical protein
MQDYRSYQAFGRVEGAPLRSVMRDGYKLEGRQTTDVQVSLTG